ncbi:hypothetical protein GCM10025857_17160 [Alicyclobacillus contaminans]|uniref:molybdenum cofactor guanylyltransferase n=1 Tax=Alicyclobacillus contaminans TaxID=392016 RepID=UPI0004076F47|nr:molybdenum cofactor guanylyltransferase [Alicyclobacillus contaminans]GMA50359.1 hypothetical protein GCM10025857_17160 [Alicyclobacillus contaminans]
MRTLGVILAGGRSRRMGVDKLRLPVEDGADETVLHHVVRVVSAVAAETYLLTGCGAAQARVPAGVRIIEDVAAYQGPLRALAHAWPQLPCDADSACLVVAGDLPGLAEPALRRLVDALAAESADVDGVLTVREGRPQPLLAIYRARVGALLEAGAAEAGGRLMPIIERCRTARLDTADWPEWWTRPIHTPEDYRAWLNHAKEGTDGASGGACGRSGGTGAGA